MTENCLDKVWTTLRKVQLKGKWKLLVLKETAVIYIYIYWKMTEMFWLVTLLKLLICACCHLVSTSGTECFFYYEGTQIKCLTGPSGTLWLTWPLSICCCVLIGCPVSCSELFADDIWVSLPQSTDKINTAFLCTTGTYCTLSAPLQKCQKLSFKIQCKI